MARTVNEAERAAKREQILGVALGLFSAQGYARTSIEDILQALDISKGAFYHYFGSKQALLEALVAQMADRADAALRPVVEDPELEALPKFRRCLETSARWKTEDSAVVLGAMRLWYADENVFFRHKLTAQARRRTPLLIEPIIRQGVAEGVFTTERPAEAAAIIAGIGLEGADSIIATLLEPPSAARARRAEDLVDAQVDAIERILGAPPGSLALDRTGLSDLFRAFSVQHPPTDPGA